MTYIKRVEIQGFKSFGNKVVLNFKKGIVSIIGANGSGKSNVSEAISFALGTMSKKQLRADRLGDLIFNGGKKGKPAKFAKVKVVFDNTDKVFPVDDDELSVVRKITAKNSEYRINGERVSRDQLVTMLSHARINPDGYNIIFQGDIERFVTMDAVERRQIIEDIAGIQIYEQKRHKSLLELSKVEDNLKKENMILVEKKKLLDELEDQKRIADEFKNAKDKLTWYKAALLFKQKQDNEAKLSKVEDEIASVKSEIDAKEREITNTQKIIDSIESELRILEEKRSVESFETAAKIREQIANAKSAVETIKANISNYKKQIDSAVEQQENIKVNIEEYEKQIATYESEISRLEEHVSRIRKELEDKEKKLVSVSPERLEDVTRTLYELRGQKHEIESKLSLIQRKEEIEQRLASLKSELSRIESKIEKEIENNSSLYEKQRAIIKKISDLEKEINILQLKRKFSYDVLSSGTRAILELRDKGEPGIIGAVYELAKSPREYNLALSVAAGSQIMSIVVESEDVAKKCINYLKRTGKGIATFLPMNIIKPYTNYSALPSGAIGYAKDLIVYDKVYENIFSYIFKDTLVVEDFEAARKLGIGRYKMVTLDGSLFTVGGAITGGHRAKERVGFSDVDIDKKIEELSSMLEEYRVHEGKISEQLNQSTSLVQSLREKKAEISKEISLLSDEMQTITSEIGDVSQELLDEINSRIKEYEKLKKEIESSAVSERDSEEIEKLRSEYEKLTSELTQKRIMLEQSLKKDIESLKQSLESAKEQEKSFRSLLEEEQKRLDSAQENLRSLIEQEKEFKKEYSELLSKYNDNLKRIQEMNDKISSIREEIRKLTTKLNNLEVKRATLSSQIYSLSEQLKEYDVVIDHVDESYAEINRQIKSLQRVYDNLKDRVNLLAWEQYNKTEQELKAISEKVQKLIDEQADICKIIDEIEAKKKDAFIETFNEINSYFSRLFAMLSPGGEAKLILQNEENPFEGGVDIIARPAGKKMTTMKALSGGEKTLVSLAFLFAIQEYDPAPFYIMDEVDAALDRSNSESFAMILKNHAKNSQIIVITHNDAVITVSDYIYGVYMQPDHSSAVVSIKLPKNLEDLDRIRAFNK